MRPVVENNSLAHLQQTLRDLASSDRQTAYKSAVPFVHVPIELLEQWSNHSRMLREVDWFRTLFTQTQIATLTAFDLTVSFNAKQLGNQIPDVPEILCVPAWLAIVKAAAGAISFVPSPDNVD